MDDVIREGAVQWFRQNGIPLHGINDNPDQHSWTDNPKAFANLYINDATLGCPLIGDVEGTERPCVYWQ